jgi:chromosome segregation ATPase
MNTEIRFNPSLSTATTTQADVMLNQPQAGAAKQAASIMGGASLTVTTAPSSDLEKLVARIKNESENTRLSLVLSSLTTLNETLTEVQKANLAQLDALDQQPAALNKDLSDLQESLTAEEANSAVMDAKIKSLEKAVERAVQEGKEHNEAVQKAKETRDRDQAKLDALKSASEKDEAAIKAAEANLAASQKALAAAVAVQRGDAAKIAAAEANLATARSQKATIDAKIDTLRKDIADTKSEIASVNSQIGSCIAAIGEKALANIAAALQSTADSFEPSDDAPSAAEQRKADKKEEANNPLNIIRDALDRLDQAIEQTVNDNRETMV